MQSRSRESSGSYLCLLASEENALVPLVTPKGAPWDVQKNGFGEHHHGPVTWIYVG